MKDDRRTHWVFDHNADDVRGWTVRDHDRNLIGTVKEMLVDPATQYVTAVVLRDGQRIAAERIQLGDHVLLVATRPARTAAAPPPPPPPARPVAATTTAAPKPVAQPPAVKPAEGTGAPRDDVVVSLASEELDVGVRRYAAGGVHLETHLVGEPVERDVRLKDEHVSVERTKVDRLVGAAEADRLFHDDTVEVIAKHEEPVVAKQAHVVEELVVKKIGTSHDETVRGTVRQMDAAITELRGGAR